MGNSDVSLKFAIFGINADGKRDGVVLLVSCTRAEIETGGHYRKAESAATGKGIKFPVSVCELDPAFNLLLNTKPKALVLKNGSNVVVQGSDGVKTHIIEIDSMDSPYSIPRDFESLSDAVGLKFVPYEYLGMAKEKISFLACRTTENTVTDTDLAFNLGLGARSFAETILAYSNGEDKFELRLCGSPGKVGDIEREGGSVWFEWIDDKGDPLGDIFDSISGDANIEIDRLIGTMSDI